MVMQERISADRLRSRIGKTMTVLVDEIGEDGVALARSPADAPEIDGVVRIARSPKLEAGEFATVRITKSDAHDLYGRVVV